MVIITLLLWIAVLIGLYLSFFWMIMFLESTHRFKADGSVKRTLNQFPFVSVLIPAYNTSHTILRCLDSVLKLDYPKNRLEIIVIDDGSTDNTSVMVSEFARQHPDTDLSIIRHQSNKGKATALNNALDRVRGDFFACLDADSFIDSATLKKMIYLFENHDQNLAIVIPAMKVYKPKTLLERLQNFEYLISILINRLNTHLESIYVAPGPFSVYRTSVVKKHGGFDSHNLTEDMEIAYRMQKHHYTIAQCYDGYVYTEAPTTLKNLYSQRKRWYKGGFLNLIKYRKMLFNPNYGHLGMYQMPVTLLSFSLAFLALFLFSYFVLYPVANSIYNLSVINFDLLPYFSGLAFDFDMLSLDLPMLTVLLGSFVVGIFLFVVSHRNAKERVKLSTVAYMVPYFLFYYLIICFFCATAVCDVFFGDKQKW